MGEEIKPATRIDALDMTKGVLVVCMVIYHALNRSNQYFLGFKYLSFLPPSFILITGFLITQVYAARHRAGAWAVDRRLLARGGKLLALFTLLNLAGNLAGVLLPGGRAMSLEYFADHWEDIYVTGSGRFAAFEVLLPISYLLLISPLLLRMENRRPLLLSLATLAAVICSVVAEQRGDYLPNLELIAAGMLGMLAGRRPIGNPGPLSSRPYWGMLAYCVYFPFGVALGRSYLVQLLGAILALVAIHGLSAGFFARRLPRSWLIRLGRYSLLSYISQIAILQALSRLLDRPAPLSLAWAVLVGSALAGMTAIVDLADRTRARSPGVDRFYRVIFA